jgi:hypothetical protein
MWAYVEVKDGAGRRTEGAAALLVSLIAATLLVLLAREFAAVRDAAVEWGTFTATSTRCEWGSCGSFGSWRSDSGSIRIPSARIDAELPLGQVTRAALLPTAWAELSGGTVVVVTEYTQSARLWVMGVSVLATTGIALVLWRGGRVRGRRRRLPDPVSAGTRA